MNIIYHVRHGLSRSSPSVADADAVEQNANAYLMASGDGLTAAGVLRVLNEYATEEQQKLYKITIESMVFAEED